MTLLPRYKHVYMLTMCDSKILIVCLCVVYQAASTAIRHFTRMQRAWEQASNSMFVVLHLDAHADRALAARDLGMSRSSCMCYIFQRI
jgi:hypothetical protein